MVYPRANGKHSLAAFLALCAVNLCVGAHAADAAAALAAVAEGACSMVVSPGDAAVGVKIVTDSSCVAGGLGCINSDCRFCKTRDTAQSEHFLNCSKIAAPATTTAPTSLPTPTPASATPCPTTKAPTPAPTPPPTTQAPTPPPTTQAPTPPPTTQAPTPPPTTQAPTPTPTPEDPAGDTLSLDCDASEGDKAVGIEAVDDATCANGGLGCFDGHCRFCKVRETANSAHLLTCHSLDPSFPTVAPSTGSPPVDTSTTCGVSPGDYAAGISAVVDAECANGGLGCFAGHCRFCKYRVTPQSGHLFDCSKFPQSTDAPTTPAPTAAPTSAPTAPPTFAPVVTPSAATPSPGFVIITDAPTEDPAGGVLEVTPTPTPSTCQTVSAGDSSFGIDIVADPSCLSDAPPVGCLEDGCRYCQVYATDKSGHLDSCSGSTPATPTPEPETEFPAYNTPAPGLDDEFPAYSTPAPGTSEYPMYTTPAPTPAPTSAPATDPVTEEPSGGTLDLGTCKPVSDGDAKVGIQIVAFDCASNPGTGCIDDTCRFCKIWDSDNSRHLPTCASLGHHLDVTTPAPTAATPAPAPASAETEPPAYSSPASSDPAPPTPAPTPLATSTPAACTAQVSSGDAQAGIAAVADASCVDGGLGCFADVCRYCRNDDTDKSHHLLACSEAVVSVKMAKTETGMSLRLSELLRGDTSKWFVGGAALIGVAAVVAMVAVSVKRAVRRVQTILRVSDDEKEDEKEDVEAGEEKAATNLNAGDSVMVN